MADAGTGVPPKARRVGLAGEAVQTGTTRSLARTFHRGRIFSEGRRIDWIWDRSDGLGAESAGREDTAPYPHCFVGAGDSTTRVQPVCSRLATRPKSSLLG